MSRTLVLLACTVAFPGQAACTRPSDETPPPSRYALNGPLIPARMTMMTAWDVPNNPLAASLDGSPRSQQIRWGFRLFMNTPAEASRFVPGQVSCTNCHLNAGQRERALPLVAIAGVFPEYSKRAGRPFTLADRIVDCFVRSENASAAGAQPTTTSSEVVALSAYITWLSSGYAAGTKPWWRGQNTIASAALVPVRRLDAAKGEALFSQHCTNCHGPDGQGVFIGDKRPAPLWGPNSWNDGAGAARIYTLAGMIRYTMPYLNPGSLSDEDAQQLAAFIATKPRPAYPFKDQDYVLDPLPPDAVYYVRPARTR